MSWARQALDHLLRINVNALCIACVDVVITIDSENITSIVLKLLVLILSLLLFLIIDQAKAKVEFIFARLVATLNIDDSNDCIVTELFVRVRLNELEQNSHLLLILFERCSEHVATLCLLTGLQHCVHDLLDRLIFFVLNEGLEGPSHCRLVLNFEFYSNFTTFNRINVDEVSGNTLGHQLAILLVLLITR